MSESANEILYVGLRNEGATCYLNSMLQSLFHNPHFRRLIYCIEVNAINREIPVVDALQRIFYEMELQSEGIRTIQLIEHFDWDEMTLGAQQDIEEFAIRLFDQLEESVRFSPLHKELCTLLSGERETRVEPGRRCTHIVLPAVTERFWNIQLSISDSDAVSDALNMLLEPTPIEEYTFFNLTIIFWCRITHNFFRSFFQIYALWSN